MSAQLRLRHGFTIIETTIAMTVLVAAVLVVVGQFQNVRSIQRTSRSDAMVDQLVNSMIERLTSVKWDDLGTSRAPWSVPRYESGAGSPPMTEFAANNDDNLTRLGLLSTGTDMEKLNVYVEYWRGVDFRDSSGNIDSSKPGALETAFTTSAGFKAGIYMDPANPDAGLKATFRLAGWTAPTSVAAATAGTSPTTQVGPDDPLLIRIVATWGTLQSNGKPLFRRESFTARAP